MDKLIIPDIPFQVLVRCLTYNQVEYIEDALNGFIMQKTNFPFVCVIIDDASTDGEQDVILSFLEREFDFSEESCTETNDAHVIVAKHKTNVNCTFAVYFLKENHHSKRRSKVPYASPWREKCKYEALCEGDDYWIDPLKLQKQYEILENNPEVSMCVTEAKILSKDRELDWRRYTSDCYVPIEDIIEKGGLWLQTASFFFRKYLLETMPECGKKCHVGDSPLMIWSGLVGKVYYLSAKSVVYRYGIGWTSSFNKQPIEKRIIAWKSGVNMLRGYNEISNHKYTGSFELMIYTDIMHNYLSNFKNKQIFLQEFGDVIRGTRLKIKLRHLYQVSSYKYKLKLLLCILKFESVLTIIAKMHKLKI